MLRRSSLERATLAASFAVLAACGDGPTMGSSQPVAPGAPSTILTTLNTNPDTSRGPRASALTILDVDTGRIHVFPLSEIAGGSLPGQAMHTSVTADHRKVYVTMGGNTELTLRLAVIELRWKDGVPTPRIDKVIEMLAAGTPGNEANGAACHPGGPGIRQEGHGTRITRDGRFLTLSELQNDRVRILDTRTDRFVGPPSSHASLFAPHGLYPNPSANRAAAPQYWFDHNQVSLWRIHPDTGALSYDSTIDLVDGDLEGSYLHTVRWLDDYRFYTNATQEKDQGNGKSRQSVWLVDVRDGSTRAVLGEEQLLEGVSDTVLAAGKMYVAEGNVAQFLDGEETPGYLSIWDLKDPTRPTLIKRLSAGTGLPETFSNAHGLAESRDGSVVYVESFSSNFLIGIDTKTDEVRRIYTTDDGLDATHGLYMTP